MGRDHDWIYSAVIGVMDPNPDNKNSDPPTNPPPPKKKRGGNVYMNLDDLYMYGWMYMYIYMDDLYMYG